MRASEVVVWWGPEDEPWPLEQGAGTTGLAIEAGGEDRGHHRLTIDPAVDDEAAIRCYEKVGFGRVGVMHAYWRDHRTGESRDGLLMELVSIEGA